MPTAAASDFEILPPKRCGGRSPAQLSPCLGPMATPTRPLSPLRSPSHPSPRVSVHSVHSGPTHGTAVPNGHPSFFDCRSSSGASNHGPHDPVDHLAISHNSNHSHGHATCHTTSHAPSVAGHHDVLDRSPPKAPTHRPARRSVTAVLGARHTAASLLDSLTAVHDTPTSPIPLLHVPTHGSSPVPITAITSSRSASVGHSHDSLTLSHGPGAGHVLHSVPTGPMPPLPAQVSTESLGHDAGVTPSPDALTSDPMLTAVHAASHSHSDCAPSPLPTFAGPFAPPASLMLNRLQLPLPSGAGGNATGYHLAGISSSVASTEWLPLGTVRFPVGCPGLVGRVVWKDQGSGTRKGTVWLHGIPPLFGFAPHEMAEQWCAVDFATEGGMASQALKSAVDYPFSAAHRRSVVDVKELQPKPRSLPQVIATLPTLPGAIVSCSGLRSSAASVVSACGPGSPAACGPLQPPAPATPSILASSVESECSHRLLTPRSGMPHLSHPPHGVPPVARRQSRASSGRLGTPTANGSGAIPVPGGSFASPSPATGSPLTPLAGFFGKEHSHDHAMSRNETASPLCGPGENSSFHGPASCRSSQQRDLATLLGGNPHDTAMSPPPGSNPLVHRDGSVETRLFLHVGGPGHHELHIERLDLFVFDAPRPPAPVGIGMAALRQASIATLERSASCDNATVATATPRTPVAVASPRSPSPVAPRPSEWLREVLPKALRPHPVEEPKVNAFAYPDAVSS